MSFLGVWLMVRGWASLAWRAWAALPGPIKAAILIVIALVVGVLYGEHREAAKCEARIATSIKAAQSADVQIAQDARGRAERQMMEAEARSAADKGEVRSYVEELATRTVAACRTGADADRINDGLGVSDDAVPEPRADPAGERRRGPVARPVPPRKGQ